MELLEPDRINVSAGIHVLSTSSRTIGQISTQKVFLNRIMFYNVYVSTHTEGT